MAGAKQRSLSAHPISEETPMSTSAVSSSTLQQQLQQYFQTRQSDLQQLSQALGSGDLSTAQTAYNNIVSLGQNGPFANGQPFWKTQRDQDLTAVGQALQNGDLTGAQQAFQQLESTFNRSSQPGNTGSGGSSTTGPEIVLNLSSGNTGTPEQVTINISNASSGGGEQVSLSVGSQGSTADEITFNLGANTNEQVVLNLLGASGSSGSASSASGASTTGSGISVSA
jgi:hypothetical protein